MYDIKLISACNGLLLFAKEEYWIYGSGNVVGELCRIGKNEAVHFSAAWKIVRPKKEKTGERGIVPSRCNSFSLVDNKCFRKLFSPSRSALVKAHSWTEWYNTIQRKWNANVSSDIKSIDDRTDILSAKRENIEYKNWSNTSELGKLEFKKKA